jgi:hypothetical protein
LGVRVLFVRSNIDSDSSSLISPMLVVIPPLGVFFLVSRSNEGYRELTDDGEGCTLIGFDPFLSPRLLEKALRNFLQNSNEIIRAVMPTTTSTRIIIREA